jgi:hypothetical protein
MMVRAAHAQACCGAGAPLLDYGALPIPRLRTTLICLQT